MDILELDIEQIDAKAAEKMVADIPAERWQQFAIIAEARAARILARTEGLEGEISYEGMLTRAAELLRARDTFLLRASHIANFGPTDLSEL